MFFIQSVIEKFKTHPFFKDIFFPIIIFLTIFINLITLYKIHFDFRLKVLQSGFDILPLHYNIYLSADYYAPFRYSYLFFIFGFLVIILNSFLAFSVYSKFKVLSYHLVISSFVVNIFILVSLFLIINFNF